MTRGDLSFSGLGCGGTDLTDAGYGLEFRCGVLQNLVFVSGNGGQPDPLQVIDGGGKTRYASDILRPGLEFLRGIVVDDPGESDVLDHAAAALVGRDAFEKLAFSVQDADAGGAEYLVGGKCKEIGVQSLDVYWQMRRGLGAIDEYGNAVGVGDCDDFLERIDGAQRIGDMRDGHDFSSLAQQ